MINYESKEKQRNTRRRRRGFLSCTKAQNQSGFCAHSSSPAEGMQGSYANDDMLQRRSAALRPEELRNKPHEANQKKNQARPPSVAGDLSPRARAASDALRARSTGDRCIRRQPPAGAKKVPDGHRRRLAPPQ